MRALAHSQISRSVRWLALLAMLLHAGWLVRHNTHVLSRHLVAWSAGVTDGVLCSADGALTSAADPSGTSHPDDPTAKCPICAGGGGSAAVLSDAPSVHVEPWPAARCESLPHTAAPIQARALPPPNRGPPSRA